MDLLNINLGEEVHEKSSLMQLSDRLLDSTSICVKYSLVEQAEKCSALPFIYAFPQRWMCLVRFSLCKTLKFLSLYFLN